MLLITGGPGEFVYSLPVVVTASLVASRIVSMTFMPLLGYYILRGQKSLAGVHPDERKGFARLYTLVSRFCIVHRWLALFAATGRTLHRAQSRAAHRFGVLPEGLAQCGSR